MGLNEQISRNTVGEAIPSFSHQIAAVQLKIGLQVAGVALVQFDYALDQVMLSPEAAVMYGLSTDELTVSRDRLHGTFHPDEFDELMETIQQVLDPIGNGWFSRDHRVLWPTGEVRWLSVRKQVFFNEVGTSIRPHSAILAAIDITERKRTEAALAEQESLFRILADNISQLAWMADTTGSVFWYNQRWFDYTGTTITQMQGWGWQDVHHPDHIDRVLALFRHCIEAGEQWEDTFPLRRKDGAYRWFLSRAFPIRDEAGTILRWFGTNTDVTELKSAQEALEERNHELDNFVHIVSHDLKAPLRAISNLSEWIEEDLEGSLSGHTQDQMVLLRQRLSRMSEMIDGLLDYARIGLVENETEVVIIEELLLEVIDTIAPPPTFTVTIAPDLPTLRTKRLLIFQVFLNLIGNGIKHHDREDGSIQVGVVDKGGCYEFSISDDGPGIPLEYQNKIFTIFRTGMPNKSKDSTGIGLAIVKKIIECQAGRIHLESRAGQGTTFYFTWPKNS
jgi:PAS domain S-box-containing protein